MTHMMVDIETMDTRPSAAILSIGACVFDPLGDDVSETFEVLMSLESNEAEGRTISAATVAWWLNQAKEAQDALFKGKITGLRHGLAKFKVWAAGHNPRVQRIWANDPDFDVVILSDAMKSVGGQWPFAYWMNRSVRTVAELAFPDKDELDTIKHRLRAEKTHHRAVDDAVMQARLVQLAVRKLNGL